MPKFQKVPKVTDGARGPSAANKAMFDDVLEPQEMRPVASEGDVLYESTRSEDSPGSTPMGWIGYAGLQIQLTSMEDVTDPKTGRVKAGRNRVAKFENGYWLHKKRGNPHFEEDEEFLRNHPDFGVGKLFWVAADQHALDVKKEYDRTVNFLKRHTALIKDLAGKLGMSDSPEFQLPPKDQPQPGA